MKDYCIIFDTNILTENKKTLNDIKTKLNLVGDIFIPKIVIEEIEAQKSRTIQEDYLKIKSIVNKNSGVFKYEEKFVLNEILTKSEKNIEKWLKNYCDGNILDYSDITINDVLGRLKYKSAPFINEIGSSDKGFKDSLIWLSILNNEIIQKYKKILLVTNDRTGFIKRSKDLYDEYNLKHTVPLFICSSIEEVYNNLGITKTEKVDSDLKQEQEENLKIENIDELREKLNTCVDNLIYFTYVDDWGNEHCDYNFNIYKKMKIEDIEYFLSLLGDFLKANVFFNTLDITELLICCGIDSAGDNVSLEYLNQLNDIYNHLKKNQDLYKPFLNYLQIRFNKLYKFKPKTEEDQNINLEDSDLPF